MTRKTFWFDESESLIRDYQGRCIATTREQFEGGEWIVPWVEKYHPELSIVQFRFTKRDVYDCLGWTTGEQEEICQIDLVTDLELALFY